MKIFVENTETKTATAPLCVGDRIDDIISMLINAECILGDDSKQQKRLAEAKIKLNELIQSLATESV